MLTKVFPIKLKPGKQFEAEAAVAGPKHGERSVRLDRGSTFFAWRRVNSVSRRRRR